MDGGDDSSPARRQALRGYGLAKVILTYLGDSGEMAVMVRIVPAAAVPRITAGLDDASVG